jgi:hypothetical protein
MELNGFTDHPVGKPLQSRQVVFSDACPVRIAKMEELIDVYEHELALSDGQKEKIEEIAKEADEADEKLDEKEGLTPKQVREAERKVDNREQDMRDVLNEKQRARLPEPILRVSPDQPGFWATRDPADLFYQMDTEPDSLVSIGEDDLDPGDDPLYVMVAAQRSPEIDGEEKTSRIIVLCAGSSLSDEYLKRGVGRIGSDSNIQFGAKPRANPEMIINAVYWLAGKEDEIAAGPIVLPTIEPIEPGKLRLIRWAVWAVWPAVILLAGVVVLLVRRS